MGTYVGESIKRLSTLSGSISFTATAMTQLFNRFFFSIIKEENGVKKSSFLVVHANDVKYFGTMNYDYSSNSPIWNSYYVHFRTLIAGGSTDKIYGHG